MKILNTIQYYSRIIFLIIFNIKSFSSFKKYYLLKLKNGTSFVVRNFMDIWTLTETYLNRDYERHGICIW